MQFKDLRLAAPIVRAVDGEGYETPTPIQAQAIPVALEGRDVLGCAQTGTGKTCAFALPILDRLAPGPDESRPGKKQRPRKLPRGRAPRALILAPTRELAVQILESFQTYGQYLPLRHTAVYGGVSQFRQVRALQNGVDTLVATPGRLLDLINQGHVDLSWIEVIVLDEADRMLDMGFIPDIRKIVEMVPSERQSLFFSATMSKPVRKLADALLRDPVSVETAPESTTIELIEQRVCMVQRPQKQQLLAHILRQVEVRRALVFTRTKFGAEKLAKSLRRSAIHADAIHGDKSQNARTRALDGFRSGHTSVLVATDVASRGIDVDEITHVFNFDMPIDPETYVHRIGRTARAGATGIAITFCDRHERRQLKAIERQTRQTIPVSKQLPTQSEMEASATDAAPLIEVMPSAAPAPAKPRSQAKSQPRSQSKARSNGRSRPVGKAKRTPKPHTNERTPQGKQSRKSDARDDAASKPWKKRGPKPGGKRNGAARTRDERSHWTDRRTRSDDGARDDERRGNDRPRPTGRKSGPSKKKTAHSVHPGRSKPVARRERDEAEHGDQKPRRFRKTSGTGKSAASKSKHASRGGSKSSWKGKKQRATGGRPGAGKSKSRRHTAHAPTGGRRNNARSAKRRG